jgi:hypothetical protein
MAAKQLQIAGTERPHGDDQLDGMAMALRKSSKGRKKAQDREVADKSALISAMKEKKLTIYECRDVTPPLIIKLSQKDQVRVEVDDSEEHSEDDLEIGDDE